MIPLHEVSLIGYDNTVYTRASDVRTQWGARPMYPTPLFSTLLTIIYNKWSIRLLM